MTKPVSLTTNNDSIQESAGDILDILLKKGWLIKAQAEEIRSEARISQKSISQLLEETNLVSKDKLLQAYSDFFNLPIVRLNNLYIPPAIVAKIPEKLAKKYHILAFDQKNGRLKVAISKPERLQTAKPGILADVQKKQKVDIDLYIAPEEDFNTAIKGYQAFKKIDSSTSEKEIQPPPLPNILDILVSQKLINQKEAFQIIETANKENISIDQVIREEGQILPDDLTKAQAQQYHIPYISLKEIDIKPENIEKFPQKISQEYQIVVFDTISDKVYKVATCQPENPVISEIIGFLKEKNQIEAHLYVTTPADIALALTKYQEPKSENAVASLPTAEVEKSKTEVKEVGELDIGTLIKNDIQNDEELQEIIKTENVPTIVAALINYALVKKASDIHIEPWKAALHVRFRIDGVLRDIIQIDRSLHLAIIARIKISARLRIDEQRIPQDGRFGANFRHKTVDIRVSTLPTSQGEKIVLRILDKSQGIISLEELGLTGRGFDYVVKNVKKPYGMVLATGPTGSGKTTTLYAILQSINTSQTNIVTLEDPIEYEIDGVNHCQARADIGFSFAEGLKSILRQDPNVIMIGEIRDKETAAMAIHASLTGHLVLSSLHTNDASGAIPRLIDMGIEPFLIASSLSVIIAQRLVRKICSKCKEKIKLPPEVLTKIEKEIDRIPKSAGTKITKPLTFWRGRGCSECEDGYSGRIGIYEVLPVTTAIQQLTIKQVTSADIKSKAIELGMITMKQDGLIKALKGITTVDEMFRVTLVEK